MINGKNVRSSIEASKLARLEEVRPDVLRAERIDAEGRTYAVYFFDVGDDVEDRDQRLQQFQDEVIGPSYFKSPGDLRWNHYLYVLASSETAANPEFAVRKRRIEQDRSYARKFVITESQLPSALASLDSPPEPLQQIQKQDVLLRWTQRLIAAKLDIVLEQRPLAETVRRISEGYVPPAAVPEAPTKISVQPDPMATKFLHQLNTANFRRLPQPPNFQRFGNVNLIYGMNGVGKTSMLEAIEYFYCGNNFRVGSPSDVKVRGQFVGARTWAETSSETKLAELRRRNLAWYGQRDLKGSSVANGFSRFNLLSTDEAALLANDPQINLEDMLARMVAGPQAADLWAHMQKLKQPLDKEIVRVTGFVSTGKSEQTRLLDQLAAAEAVPKQSDSEFTSLMEDLRRLRWLQMPTKDTVAYNVIPRLETLLSIVRGFLATTAAVSGRVTTLEAVESDAEAISRTATEVDAELEKLKECTQIFRDAEDELGRQKGLHQQFLRIHWLVRAEAFKLLQQADGARQQRDSLRSQIASSSAAANELPAAIKSLAMPVAEAVDLYAAEVQVAAAEADRLDDIVKAQLRAHDVTRQLAEEIRALTRQLLEHDQDRTECPVCRTGFQPEKLRELVNDTPENAGDVAVQQLMSARDLHKNREAEAATLYRVLEDLLSYAQRRKLDAAQAAPSLVHEDLLILRQQLSFAQATIISSEERLNLFGSDGYSVQDIRDLMHLASESALSTFDLSQVEIKLREAAEQLTTCTQAIADAQKELDEVTRRIRIAVLGASASSTMALQDILSRLQELRSFASQATELLETLRDHLLPQGQLELLTLAALLDSAKSIAERYVATVAREEQASQKGSNAKFQLSVVQNNLMVNESSLERLKHAQAVLDDIETNDSLVGATERELNETHHLTAAVWARIHSPNEYGINRGIHTPFYRIDDPSQKPVSLKEVSSGQRAAFVLSVFLAMNAKLKSGPPVILLDDPVAHIDDFNALSFLDYLRELVLSRQRQVFYATADSRLAGLFEHKFGFLGEQFRRFDLHRIY